MRVNEGEDRSDEQEAAFTSAHVKRHLDAFEATSKDTQTVTDTPRMHQVPKVSSRKLR